MPDLSTIDFVLSALFLLIAMLYSSVGHAGASGYIAAMTLLGMASPSMRPIALSLNILVASIAAVRFIRAELIQWRLLAPFVLGSMPMAWWSAQWPLAADHFKQLLGVILLLAAIKLWLEATRALAPARAQTNASIDTSTLANALAHADAPVGVNTDTRTQVVGPVRAEANTQAQDTIVAPSWWLALLCGAGIGVMSGLSGTGGAIFLTPLLLFAHWTPTRVASGVSAVFVLCTSTAALLGQFNTDIQWPKALPLWLISVAVGALIGSKLGVARLNDARLRQVLAVVLSIASAKLILA